MTIALAVFVVLVFTIFLAVMVRIARRPYLVEIHEVHIRSDRASEGLAILAANRRTVGSEIAPRPRVIRGAVTERRDTT